MCELQMSWKCCFCRNFDRSPHPTFRSERASPPVFASTFAFACIARETRNGACTGTGDQVAFVSLRPSTRMAPLNPNAKRLRVSQTSSQPAR
jgi:hypothetical protein